jgi:hypothetical protein
VFAPVGTAQAIVACLNSEIDMALSDRAIRVKMFEVAQEAVGGCCRRSSLFVVGVVTVAA